MARLVRRALVTVPRPPLVAAAAARNRGLVPSHFVDMGSGIATGGVIHEPQPAASQAAARNLERELKNATPSGPRRRTADQPITQPWSRRQQQNTGILFSPIFGGVETHLGFGEFSR